MFSVKTTTFFWPKLVGGLYMHKLISIYSCLFSWY